MHKSIAAATVAASLLAGTTAGALLGVPGLAGAAEHDTSGAGWVRDTLQELVAEGTIDQPQAEAVEAALEEARPAHGPGHHRGPRPGFAEVAEALGITSDELREALAGGQTIAEVAAAEGIDVQVVIDALVAAAEERVAAKVEAGRLTQEEADERLAHVEEHAEAVVNGERPAFRGDGRGPRGPGGA